MRRELSTTELVKAELTRQSVVGLVLGITVGLTSGSAIGWTCGISGIFLLCHLLNSKSFCRKLQNAGDNIS